MLLRTSPSVSMSRCWPWVMYHAAASEWRTWWTADVDWREDSAWDSALCQQLSTTTTHVQSTANTVSQQRLLTNPNMRLTAQITIPYEPLITNIHSMAKHLQVFIMQCTYENSDSCYIVTESVMSADWLIELSISINIKYVISDILFSANLNSFTWQEFFSDISVRAITFNNTSRFSNRGQYN